MADTSAAREQAREILSQRRFAGSDVPRPFEQPLRWLGERVDDAGQWLGGLFAGVDGALPGGSWVVWVLIALAVAGLAVLLSRLVIRRRAAIGFGPAPGPGAPPRPAPAELEREAAAAERDGDYEAAVRLRFRAGVLRLEQQRVLDPEVLRTTGEIGAALGSEAFDSLGTAFDAIAYGGRPAAAGDARAARERWSAVLEEAR